MGGGPERPDTSPAEVQLPQQFGDYAILGHLATGGMAEVYVARKTGLRGFEKIVVIKRVRPELLGEESTTSNFLDEARLVAALEHPNIAQVYEVGYDAGNYFFVMEYVDGVDLRQLVAKAEKAKKKISLDDALYIISHVSAGLHFAHEKRDLDNKPLRIIHRDVSPSNVLISHHGAVKVCDFGIAKAQNRSAETARGTLKGKFAYMSPEQCRCEDLDQRSDIFAIGVMLYELTTSSRLFKLKNDFDTLRAIVDQPIPLPSTRVKGYPKELEVIVMRALEKDPRRRYPTAQGIQLELEAFAREYKLAMSSVSIAKLVSSLFDKSDVVSVSRAQQKAQEAAEEDENDTSVHESEFAAGSTDVDAESITESHPVASRRISAPALPVVARKPTPSIPRPRDNAPRKSAPVIEKATPAPAKRGPNVIWIVAALIAGLGAVGVTVFESMRPQPVNRDNEQALSTAVERVASSIESASRSGRTRADAIASSPMLRAAIQTDAATLKDLAEAESVFRVGPRETIEIFQLKGQEMSSVLHLPTTAAPLVPLDPDQTRLVSRDRSLWLVACAAVSNGKKTGGTIEIEIPIDLGSVTRALADQVEFAAVTSADGEVPLIPAKAGTKGDRKKLAVPLPAELAGSTVLTLAVIPKQTVVLAPLAWVAPVRYASIGAAGLFVLVFLFSLIASRRR